MYERRRGVEDFEAVTPPLKGGAEMVRQDGLCDGGSGAALLSATPLLLKMVEQFVSDVLHDSQPAYVYTTNDEGVEVVVALPLARYADNLVPMLESTRMGHPHDVNVKLFAVSCSLLGFFDEPLLMAPDTGSCPLYTRALGELLNMLVEEIRDNAIEAERSVLG